MFRERGGSGMEFKYRAMDEHVAPHSPLPPSINSYFTDQAIRAGYIAPALGRMHENFQNSILVREVIQRELEKERIREEIVAAEIARRRVLEAEVRREMMLERELALRRGGNGFDRFSFLPGVGMRFEPRDLSFGRVEGWSLEERIALSLEERFGKGPRHENCRCEIRPFRERSVEPKIGGHEMIPFQQRAVEPKISEVMPTSEVSKEKEKIVFLAKPEANLSGAKRKSVTPPKDGTSELPSIGVTKKRAKEEWSCAICQVSATSERGLNEHIQGKKHKSKVAALMAQRNGRNFGIGICRKKAAKPTKLGETTNNSSSEQGGKSVVQLLQSNETGKSSLQILPFKRSPKENEVPLLEVIQKADISENEVLEADQKTQKKLANRNKFTFWCEMCRVGAYSETVMEAHRTGKKHVMGLRGAMKNKTVPTPKMGATRMNNAEEPTEDGGDDAFEKVM